METTRDRSRIGKGKPGPGRPKGGRNKLALEAEKMVDEAWHKLGGADFIVRCAQEPKNVPAVLSLFGRRVRQKVEVSVTNWSSIVDGVNRARDEASARGGA